MTSSLIAMPPNNLLIQPVIVPGDETLSHNKKWTKYKPYVDTHKMFFCSLTNRIEIINLVKHDEKRRKTNMGGYTLLRRHDALLGAHHHVRVRSGDLQRVQLRQDSDGHASLQLLLRLSGHANTGRLSQRPSRRRSHHLLRVLVLVLANLPLALCDLAQR